MDKIKKVYVDSRYRTPETSSSDSDFHFELKEGFEAPDNTVCYVDDICIPHTWRTVESNNNKLYIILRDAYLSGSEFAYNYNAFVLEIPEKNYTGDTLASTIHELLTNFATNHNFVVSYNVSTGSISINATNNDGIYQEYAFHVASDYNVRSWSGGWKDRQGNAYPIDLNNLKSINNVLRNNEMTDYHTFYREFESGFLDLLNVHNIYLHCPHIGSYTSIGVRGENTIIKKIPVSSSFGYLILDSVVAQHDKIDVSRQSIKTLRFSLKDVHGNVINLHGASVSFSLIFVSAE
jgi:hypothetical protein